MGGLSLGLVSAGLLALGVLALGPVLAHLARQRPVERQPFGAMMLLGRLPRNIRRRKRLQDPLLLLLRILAISLVVLAAARPELRIPEASPEIGAMGRVVVVVDNSLSMSLTAGPDLLGGRGGTLLARAREQAAQALASLPEGTEVGAVATSGPGGEAHALSSSLTTDRQLVIRRVEALSPTHGGTDLGGALRAARRLLGGEPGEVLVFSDEAGPETVKEAEGEVERLLETGSVLLPSLVSIPAPANLQLAGARYGDGIEGGSLTVQVRGFGPEARETAVTATLPGGEQMTAFVHVPACSAPPDPCEPVEVTFTVPPEVPGGVAEVHLEDGHLDLDDRWWFHLPRVGTSRVLVVDGEPGPTPIESEVYFLERALAPWALGPGGVLPEVTAPAGLGSLDLDDYRVVFLCNVSQIRPLADQLSMFVRKGGGLVITAGENITRDAYNTTLGALMPGSIREIRNLVALDEAGGVRVVPPDPAHPLFSPFRRGGRTEFSRVHARRAVILEPASGGDDPDGAARVATLLSLENGLPLMVERQTGRGRVIFLAGTVDLAWGNMPLQAVFMPLVQRLVAWLGGESGPQADHAQGTVGDLVALAAPADRQDLEVRGPGGAPVAFSLEGGEVRFRPVTPGAYTIGRSSEPPAAHLAVNTPAAESDIRRHGSLRAAQAALDPTLLNRRVELAPGLLVAALGLLILQAGAGLRSSGRTGEEDQ